MDNLIYKIKQMFRKALPLVLMGGLLYGGYHLYRQGTFRRGVGPAVTSILHKVPYFGSRFRHYYGGRPSYSYVSSRHRSHGRRHGRGRHHRRHHR